MSAGSLTAEQASTLEDFRRKAYEIAAPLPSLKEDQSLFADHYLLRFLRARQWRWDAAVEMLAAHYKWREEKKVLSLMRQTLPELAVVKRFYPTGYHSTDKKGRPIYIERIGKLDMERLMQHVSMDQVVENYIRESEKQVRTRLPACCLAQGEVVDRSLNIVDLDGLSFRLVTHSMAKKVVKEIMAVSQNHYPEMMGQTVVINCPKIFSMAWSSLKSMLDENTIKKISIHDCAGTKAALLKLVDADKLPTFLGGLCECKCEGGCLGSNIGPWHREDIKAYLASDPQMYWKALSPEGCRALIAREMPPAPAEPTLQAEAASEADAEPMTPVTAMASEEQLPATPEVAPHAKEPARLDTPGQLELARLRSSHEELEQLHLQTLVEWMHFYKEFVTQEGRHTVERAQGYYDARSVKARLQREVISATELCADLTEQFARMREHHRRLEDSFSAFMANPESAEATISDEEWARMVPDAPEIPAAFLEDGKLLRAWRMATLSDRMSQVQVDRDRAQNDLTRLGEESRLANERFEEEEAKHQFCTWNCSVQRAEDFYSRREAHEEKIEKQVKELRFMEEQLAAARLAVEAEAKEVPRDVEGIEGSRPGSSADQLAVKDLTPADYEIADFYSCSSGGEESDTDRETVLGDKAA